MGTGYFEKHAVQLLGSKYRPVLGLQRWDFDIDMDKKEQVDFLGVGNGIEAWQAFAKDYEAHMHNDTYTKLQKPHFPHRRDWADHTDSEKEV